MTTLTLDPPPTTHFRDPRGGEATLDEAIVDAWEGLAAARAVACPVCGGAMAAAAPAAEGKPPLGACADCGAELS
jgi:hypothetical protein